MGKEAIYCKSKRTYTNECDCEDTARCPHYWRQGLGSLTGNGTAVVNNTSSERTSSNSRSGAWD